jgi:large subunit ribosomal protein L30e
MADMNKMIAMAVKTGKVLYGAKSSLNSAKSGKVRLVIVSKNAPEGFKKDIKQNCSLSNIPITIYPGTSLDLGRICGKLFRISALTIRDPGDSDILKMVVEDSV